MKQTIAEKILSAKAGATLRAGDIAICRIDAVMGTDGSVPMAIDYFGQLGERATVAEPDRIVFALDHYAPAPTPKSQALQDVARAFARERGIRVWEVGEGIGHQLMVEQGYVTPGALVLGADSHAVTYGALNAFGTGIGSSDLAVAMASGKAWLKVPETIRVELTGALRAPAAAKDVALELLRRFGGDGARYQVLEFTGPGVAALDMADRLVISNMVVEMGAKAGVFPCDARTLGYLEGRPVRRAAAPVAADPGASYAGSVRVDLSSMEPLVARPHQPDLVGPLRDAGAVPVHMVYLGTCTGGRAKDLREALAVLQARGGVRQGVQLVVTPASREVEQELEAGGELAQFRAMGATLGVPGCGSCCGTCGTIPADGQTVVSTANRNFIGRMGNPKASIWLASPAACAAAAAEGSLVALEGAAP
ncbi:aconitase/3-isopropylmalate dehydratase large subunit family protein [Ramlibacter tataouinensis]|uniref:3-isopropylmalate dehydratase large subunit n=1 Tax=Ramlibacter tataouinensis TaxID=94132 RepID=UPI0022F3B318|nr:aconitase/3-isopropylmalate dehydratase large subunit family protein [Ramlibacter tataouinensis]WBY01428.1 aconitase/3-isopropylmalate dehydratase large subunit family protein [Ramlibacter tataouinensis]